MDINNLHKILDNENKKISVEEFRNIVYELKDDVVKVSTALSLRTEDKNDKKDNKIKWYQGEANAFQLVLDLAEHLWTNEDKESTDQQGHVWRDSGGKYYDLKDIGDNHLKNIIHFIVAGGGVKAFRTKENVEKLYQEAQKRGLSICYSQKEVIDSLY